MTRNHEALTFVETTRSRPSPSNARNGVHRTVEDLDETVWRRRPVMTTTRAGCHERNEHPAGYIPAPPSG